MFISTWRYTWDKTWKIPVSKSIPMTEFCECVGNARLKLHKPYLSVKNSRYFLLSYLSLNNCPDFQISLKMVIICALFTDMFLTSLLHIYYQIVFIALCLITNLFWLLSSSLRLYKFFSFFWGGEIVWYLSDFCHVTCILLQTVIKYKSHIVQQFISIILTLSA